MKKIIFSLLVIAMSVTSCSFPAKLINSATHKKMSVAQPVVAVFADLQVSPEKITYFMMPSKTVVMGGYDNVIDTAVREALLANGNADVLVALEKQVKYDKEGQIESVTITGYPAKYVNFRSPGDDYLKEISASATSEPESQGGLFGKLKLGK